MKQWRAKKEQAAVSAACSFPSVDRTSGQPASRIVLDEPLNDGDDFGFRQRFIESLRRGKLLCGCTANGRSAPNCSRIHDHLVGAVEDHVARIAVGERYRARAAAVNQVQCCYNFCRRVGDVARASC